VLLLASLAGLRQYNAHRRFVAAEAFRRATALVDSGDTHSLTTALDKIPNVGSYPALTDLYRGYAALNDADGSTAADAFRSAARRSDLPPYLRQRAFYGLGTALAAQGDTEGALAQFEQAADLPGPFSIDARLAAARLSQTSGDPSKARTLYQLAMDDAEGGGPAQNDLRNVAAWHLARLAAPEPAPAATPGSASQD
jgi:tetratricopeptide (TPR) repeat protein